MGAAAHPPEVVAALLMESVEHGGPFYVICPGSTGARGQALLTTHHAWLESRARAWFAADVEEFKRSYQTHADDFIQQGPPLSQFMGGAPSRGGPRL